jgi:hypothetical protein
VRTDATIGREPALAATAGDEEGEREEKEGKESSLGKRSSSRPHDMFLRDSEEAI